MRVAVAANDSASISQHFGRSASWRSYGVEGEADEEDEEGKEEEEMGNE